MGDTAREQLIYQEVEWIQDSFLNQLYSNQSTACVKTK